MTPKDINTFVETMTQLGDVWEPHVAEGIYGDCTLQEALEDRKMQLEAFDNALKNVIK